MKLVRWDYLKVAGTPTSQMAVDWRRRGNCGSLLGIVHRPDWAKIPVVECTEYRTDVRWINCGKRKDVINLPVTVVHPGHAFLKESIEVVIKGVGRASSHLPDSAVQCYSKALKPLTMSEDQTILNSPQGCQQLRSNLRPLVIDPGSSVHDEYRISNNKKLTI